MVARLQGVAVAVTVTVTVTVTLATSEGGKRVSPLSFGCFDVAGDAVHRWQAK